MITEQQKQEQMRRFFNPGNDDTMAPPAADAAPAPIPAAAPAPAPPVAPSSAPGHTAAPPAPAPAPNPQQPAAAAAPDNSNYMFHPVTSDAFMPARPVSQLDNVHGLRKGLALAFGGLASFGGGLNHNPDHTLEGWTNQELAQRQYDQNTPTLRARAQMEADQANQSHQRTAGEIAQTEAGTNLTNTQASNLKLVGPPGKQDFLKEFAGKLQSGQFDPTALFNEYANRGGAFGVSRQDLVGLMNNTPESALAAKVGPQGIAEPVMYHGKVWNGTEPDAPDVVKRAFQTEKPVEDKIHQNKIQEQSAARSNIVLKNDLQNGPLGGKYSVPAGASGEDALANVDPATAATVRMLADGKADFQTFASRMSPAAKTNLAALVHAYNPEFNQASYSVQKDVQKDLTSGGKSNTILAYNTSLKHLDSFLKVASKLNNGDFTPLNELAQATGMKFGSDASTNFALARDFFSGEVGKAAAGTTATQAERQEIADKVSRASSWTQLQGAAATAKEFLEGKRSAMQHQAEQGLKGKADFGSEGTPQQQHIIQVGNKRYQYKGSGDTADLKNYTETK